MSSLNQILTGAGACVMAVAAASPAGAQVAYDRDHNLSVGDVEDVGLRGVVPDGVDFVEAGEDSDLVNQVPFSL